MKQIKTISRPLDHAAGFDDAVNSAIREGWKLTKRDVLQPQAQIGPSTGVHFEPMLYAELECEVITEAERCCENCAHYQQSSLEEPCRNCVDGEAAPTKWEEAGT